jgi:hypothetical protein
VVATPAGAGREALLAGAMLASGIALVIAIMAGLPLWLTLGLLGTAAVLLVALRWRQSNAAARMRLRA